MPLPVISAAEAPDVATMTIAQLRTESLRLAAVLTLCSSQRKAILAEAERRQSLVHMQQRIAGMSEVDKDALRAVLALTP